MAANSESSIIEIYLDASNNSNAKDIVCKICGSCILKSNVCNFTEKEFALPYMKGKDEAGNSLNDKTELVTRFWTVSNMMDFENVGFSHNVGTIKYLTCADCEIGPVGYHDTQNPKEFFIAVERVKYK